MMRTHHYILTALLLLLLPSCKMTESEKLEKLLRGWNGAVAAIFAGYNVHQSDMNSQKLSDVMLENVEALADNENNVIKREFDIRLKQNKLPVIEKFDFNGGFLIKEAICSNGRQSIGNEIIERPMS